ncbi:unnamed protein product [Rotaria magnacalcarata]|uniref:PNPLA domain-containing protein n=1 Tax=Rotaria magnacalcarata TaxID=392030 RepID=A0A816LT58_9BILA|nr:unnamed protein product [Rotaria magnacalcarata]CAF4079217.1 unnamed protein product [Rotaria magnacalcarata]
MSLKLSNLFQQIDAAIATASSAENMAKVFKNTLEFIQDNLEGEDEAQFNQAKYQYHFKKFKYLSSVGKHEESKREENLSKRYGSKLQPVQQSSMTGNNIGQSFESQIFDNPIQSQNSALSYATTAVQQCSTRLQEMCSHFPDMKSVVTDIEILVGNFIVDTIHSYEEYSDVNTTASKIRLILNLLKNQITTTTLTVNQEATTVSNDVSNNNQSEIAALAGAFCITVDKCLVEYRRILCHFVLSQRNNIMQILFSNVPATQERIISHARKLSLLFHPDKAEESDRIEFREVFDCIILCKQKLIDKLTSNGDISDRELVNHHQTAGKRLWEIARDYSRARNRAWTTLVHLREDDLKSQTEEELEQYQKSFASQAYEQYRAAAIALGDQGTAEERSEMRRMMAISLYTGEQLLQAQIYAIAAMHILAQNTGRAEAEKLNALQQLLEKIRSPKVSTRVETANSSTVIPPTSQPSNSKAIVSVNVGGLSALRQRAHIKDELRDVVIQQCLLTCKEKQVKTSEELILTAKRKATQHKVAGIALQAGSTIVAGGIVASAFSNTLTTIIIASALGTPGIILAVGAGVGVAIGGLILGKDLFNTGTALFQEPTIRETLNSKLYVALKHHKAQLYAAFLHELASDYSTGCSLISIVKDGKKISIDIDPREIVQKLLNHEFRPDGIAYLLNLIGEALLNKPVLMHQEKDFSSLHQPLFSTMNELAIKCFSEVFSARSVLLEQAEELDRRVQKISLQDAEIRFFSKIKKNIKSKYSSYAFSIPKEYFTDALRTPYTTRLRELGDIARLNFAIVNIIIGGTDNFDQSQDAVLEVKRQQVLSAHNQFFMISDTLIQAIDDLLLAFGLIPKPLVDKDILSLEDNAVFENIQKIKVNNAIIECGSVNKVSNISQLLKVLGELNNFPATLSQEEFAQQVEELAERNSENENFKTSITELLKADKVHNLQDWRSCYSLEENCTPKKAHIPFLSQIFNVNIYTGTIVMHPTKGRLFVAQDFPQTNPPVQSVIFVVLDKNYTDIIGAVKTCDLSLNSLYNELHIASTNQKKIEIFQKLAIHHRLNAEHFEKVHRLQALTHWHEAKKSYTKILGLDSNNLDAALGFGKSLCMLSKLETAEAFLRRTVAEHPHSAEAWYLLAFTKRKRHLYEEANYFIQKALEKDSNYGEAINESKVISTLLSHSMSDRLKVYNNMALSHKSTSGNSSSDYNVLSIDGGGIRGLIPAVWLAELERRIKRSVASLFRMIAGVSTGAIVAAGLCAPSSENPCEPRYKAVDIVKLYETRSNEVFQRAPTWIPSPLWQFCQDVKYTDSGRQDLFSEYFGNMRLSHALTDLVIPAVKSDGRQTHLFNRHNCRANNHHDHFLREVLMCTTAAPTYFRPYILGDSHFVDGGVQMNNPASAAYNECIRYRIESKDIFMLSLGTGDFVPDPLHPGSNRHLLFYLSHRKEIMNMILDGPQYNFDVLMMSLLKEKYQRWQVWFDKPIELDNTDASSIELLFEQARAHFEEIDAYDNGKRLGLLIDRLRGDAH